MCWSIEEEREVNHCNVQREMSESLIEMGKGDRIMKRRMKWKRLRKKEKIMKEKMEGRRILMR